jgi:hypothetical protein
LLSGELKTFEKRIKQLDERIWKNRRYTFY